MPCGAMAAMETETVDGGRCGVWSEDLSKVVEMESKPRKISPCLTEIGQKWVKLVRKRANTGVFARQRAGLSPGPRIGNIVTSFYRGSL